MIISFFTHFPGERLFDYFLMEFLDSRTDERLGGKLDTLIELLNR